MGKFVFGIVVGLIVAVLSVYFYFATGRAPVATSDPAMPLEKMLASKALNARIEREMPGKAPLPADESNYLAGAKVYRENCAMCHGIPGQPRTNAAMGMYPYPPELFKGKGVTDDPAGETYWKAKNGIRLTGMPGFKETLSDTQLWQVSLVLANADKLPQSVRDSLSAGAGTAASPSPTK